MFLNVAKAELYPLIIPESWGTMCPLASRIILRC
jgi:hypothetical protein